MTNKEILYDGYRTRYKKINMDYTIQELALIVSVSQMEIQIIETGKTNPNIDICRRIADALAYSIESLFGYVDEEPINPYYYYPEVRTIIYKETAIEKAANKAQFHKEAFFEPLTTKVTRFLRTEHT